jgi:hypothetical protein
MQNEKAYDLPAGRSRLSSLAAVSVRPATASATDGDPLPTHSDSGTPDSHPGAAYSNAHPADTYVHPGAPHADHGTPHAHASPPYTNGHPSDTHADGRAPHAYAVATHLDTDSADTNARAQGVDGSAGSDQLLRDTSLFHHCRVDARGARQWPSID